jgi:hypothetical protein
MQGFVFCYVIIHEHVYYVSPAFADVRADGYMAGQSQHVI